MHASNPYGSKIDYAFYEKNIPIWHKRIRNLLNSHQIILVNTSDIHLIHMKEAHDDKVHHYIFGLASENKE
jgi:hypothetical protein